MNVGTTPPYCELVRRHPPAPTHRMGLSSNGTSNGHRQTYVQRILGDRHMPARPRQRLAILPVESDHLVDDPAQLHEDSQLVVSVAPAIHQTWRAAHVAPVPARDRFAAVQSKTSALMSRGPSSGSAARTRSRKSLSLSMHARNACAAACDSPWAAQPSTAMDPWAASGPVVGPSGRPIGSSQGLVKPARDERSQARSSHAVDPLLELLFPEPCRELELRQGC